MFPSDYLLSQYFRIHPMCSMAFNKCVEVANGKGMISDHTGWFLGDIGPSQVYHKLVTC